MTSIDTATATTPARVLDAAARGARIDLDEAETLLHAEQADFERLLEVAASLRDEGLAAAGRPGVITYSRKAFLPLTTLCRDRCHYCVFVDTPGQLAKLHKPLYMSAEQVLQVARQAQALGCKEALLTLGDRPEDRWPAARTWLDEHGYTSTLDYVAAMARLITASTDMLAHANPGVMSRAELDAMRTATPSMGMMLETTSRRLYEEPGQVHYGSPDKDPAVRLQVIEDAGAARIPFTTGILVGIGETVRDRAESLVAIRAAHERHGHVQEVIVQNFRAKPGTAMRGAPDAELREYLATVAVARIVMGPRMRIQVPPNLTDAAELELLVRAGIDDWGGVSPLTADHVNPERPWPQIDDLAAHTAAAGFRLNERLTAHPEYVRDAATWIDPALHGAVAALADPETGLARSDAPADSVGNTGSIRSNPALRAGNAHLSMLTVHTGALPALAEAAASAPLSLDDGDWERLLRATGRDLDALTQTADDVRRYTVGEAVSIVVNRNLTTTGFREAPAGDPATFTLDDVAAIAADAHELGATELCIQGRVPDAADPAVYLDIVRAAKSAAPELHLHAYRPQDVWDFAERSGLELDAALRALRDAGVGTVPGTGVKVLSERVRALVAPGDLEIDRWTAGITAAHRAGLRSTSVLFYGHVETAAERIAHLRALRAIQGETGGFAEFVPIPLPAPAGGVPLVDGRSPLDEHRAMVAVSRLLLNGSIRHIQIPWTRVGREVTKTLLQSGGDDLGGTLLDGRVRPQAGIEAGLELPVADAAAMASHLFRPFRQRATDYAEVRRA
ncbi:7,8-didemethyl-8-hydroxy-5-deazariboflavin synthase CofG [Microbacterium horticulturae]|uniref:7,8-didemethyl-8-hydroxy-5-deazariboflavin synthase n=1 Tax=Microbacterium horticulturae TaxID=3028316 RepID=A0ABY8BVW7_9MICO|nr:7,8-didemethyl-8-hydroxy-5-deazariboflavin synthase CofG [Microbacterium sp. KACC 23027]WEG08333.1 7,8-didemethyl-8-hydroxy-5-deazariboflavin synthase CofG [Microbacterium sp. KACC 23027]